MWGFELPKGTVEIAKGMLYNSTMIDEELVRRMERDELIDKAYYYGLISVREFARIMQTVPQLVYYRVRTKKITLRTCPTCGREGLVDFREAVPTFRHTPKDVQAAEEAQREDMESGDTED